LSAEELAKLQSLGYLRGGVDVTASSSKAATLPDPKDRIAEAVGLDDAEKALEAGRAAEAIPRFVQVVLSNPGNHTALQGLARAYLREGDLRRAEDAALKALAAAGADPACPAALTDNARALLTTVLYLLGRPQEAAKTLRAPDGGSAASAPQPPSSLLMAAAKNQTDAKAILDQAVRRLPNDPWTWAASVEYARRTGDRAGLEAALRTLIGLGPNAAAALLDAGVRAQEAGDLALARTLFEGALRVRPDHPDVLGYVGTARLAVRDLDGADKAFRRVRDLRPEDPRAPMYLAEIALVRGDEAGARQWIDDALRKSPRFIPPLLNYARWLAEKGRVSDAIGVAESAVAIRPEDAAAATLLRELRARAGVGSG